MAIAEPIPFSPDADYVDSPEIRQVAEGLIGRHSRFQDVDREFRVVYLERLGEPSGDGEGVIAKCQKASPLWRDVAGVDLVIWVWREVWHTFSPRQREAVVAHELCHAFVDEKGKLKLLPHDLEEFAWVVRQYGPWRDEVRIFGEQLAAFGEEPTQLKSRRS